MKKSEVNGDNTNDVYKYLKNEKAGILGLTRIKWNFEVRDLAVHFVRWWEYRVQLTFHTYSHTEIPHQPRR